MARIKIGIRVWILIFCLFLAVLAINPSGFFKKGVMIKSVKENTTAFEEGFKSGEIITEINLKPIETLEDYTKVMTSFAINPIKFEVETDKGKFSYTGTAIDFEINANNSITRAYGDAVNASLKENMTVLYINGKNVSYENFKALKQEIEPHINLNIKTNRNEYVLSLNKPLEITAIDVPKTNIKAGLDLQGGARGLVKPERALTSEELENLLLISRERLNVYGISDVNVRTATDMSGNTYMLVEVAGATPQELEDLVAKQGKFEAKISNKTVFIGGKRDIASVCRNDAKCARIQGCSEVQNGYICEFNFAVYLSEQAAQKQAEATKNLIVSEGDYLNESLDLVLDDKLVDSLKISSDLKGKAVTQVAISGPGYGATEIEAYENAQKNMLKLQTILITGSLPFKLEIAKLDNISPMLGKEFVKSVIFVLVSSIFLVSLILFLRYRKIITTLPIIMTMLSETLLVLGIASLIKWNLDLASIAGIIAATGTGVDDQIVILDESLSSEGRQYSIKERIKRAFSIILGSFSTVTAAMLPLLWAGAGLLKGFALTTIIGITVGVLITRPAYAEIVRQISKE